MPPIQPPRRAKLRFQRFAYPCQCHFKHMYQPGDAFKIISWYPPPFHTPASYGGPEVLLEFQAVFAGRHGLRQRDPGRFAQRRVYALYPRHNRQRENGPGQCHRRYRSIQKTIRNLPPQGNANMDFHGVRAGLSVMSISSWPTRCMSTGRRVNAESRAGRTNEPTVVREDPRCQQ